MIDRNRIKTLYLDGFSQERLAEKFGLTRKAIRKVLFEFGIVANPEGRKTASAKAIIVSDIHVPNQNNEAVNAVIEFCKYYQPTHLFWNGDIVNFDSISCFTKNKHIDTKELRLVDEIDALSDIRQRFELAVPKSCKKIYNLGNHEQIRIDAYVNENPTLEGIIDIKKIMGNSWEINQYNELIEFGKLLITHGIYHNMYYAKKHLDMLGKSLVMGHLHQQQQFSKSVYGGEITCISSGCLCDLNPKYMKMRPKAWSHGYITVELDKDGNFFINNIKIVNGKFSYNGEIFGG